MRQSSSVPDEDIDVPAVLRIPGEPDKDVVVRMPRWAAPRKGK